MGKIDAIINYLSTSGMPHLTIENHHFTIGSLPFAIGHLPLPGGANLGDV